MSYTIQSRRRFGPRTVYRIPDTATVDRKAVVGAVTTWAVLIGLWAWQNLGYPLPHISFSTSSPSRKAALKNDGHNRRVVFSRDSDLVHPPKVRLITAAVATRALIGDEDPSQRPKPASESAEPIEQLAIELLHWAADQGIEARITSMHRAREKQTELWANRRFNPYPVAPPGHSLHEVGRAFDLAASPEDLVRLGEEWEQRGGHWGGHFGDPVHFER